MKTRKVYLDYQASTPVDSQVLQAMLPYFTEDFANPSSKPHLFGLKAEAAVENARESIAENLHCHPEEVFFMSGATEANNLVFSSLYSGPVLISSIEHASVREAARALKRKNIQVLELPVYSDALLAPEVFSDFLNQYNTPNKPTLCSVIWANNEVGTIQNICKLSELAQKKKVLFHSDAVQALGKIPIDLSQVPIDFMSASAHKFYGPKGVGFLFVRRAVQKQIRPSLLGGGQERGYRSGTLNVPGIVGMAKALDLSIQNMDEENKKLQVLRDYFWAELKSNFPEAQMNASLENRLTGNLNIYFPGVDGAQLMLRMKNIAISSGSACSSSDAKASGVLQAMALSEERARSSLRFSLGRQTSQDDLAYVLQTMFPLLKELRLKL